MTEPEERPRRRVPQSAILAAISVVGLLTVGLVLLHDDGSSAHRTPPGATLSGVPPTRGNLVLRQIDAADVRGVVLVPGDPTALDIVVNHSTREGECSLFDPRVTVQAESASEVLIRASGYAYLPQAASASGGAVGFGCMVGGAKAIRVHLNQPLAGRRVGYEIGATRVNVVPADPQDSPTPRYLPPGYALTQLEPVDAASGRLTALRVYRNGADELSLQVGVPDELLPGKPALGRTTVDGAAATITRRPDGTCVTWREPSGRARQLCSRSGTTGSLPVSELVRIARSVR